MRITAVALIMLVFSGCSSIAKNEFYSGENLLQPMPLPEEAWQAYSKKDGSSSIMKWSKNNSKDEVITHIYTGSGYRDVERDKSLDDQIGQRNCVEFSTSKSEVIKEFGYNTLIWTSNCRIKSGISIAVLHKVISGKDSFYHLRRIWKSDYSEASLQQWKDYFMTVHVCDTGASDVSACPEGFERVR